MEIWLTPLAVVFLGAVLFALDAHAYPMLPDFAFFALDHEAHVFRFSLCERKTTMTGVSTCGGELAKGMGGLPAGSQIHRVSPPSSSSSSFAVSSGGDGGWADAERVSVSDGNLVRAVKKERHALLAGAPRWLGLVEMVG